MATKHYILQITGSMAAAPLVQIIMAWGETPEEQLKDAQTQASMTVLNLKGCDRYYRFDLWEGTVLAQSTVHVGQLRPVTTVDFEEKK